MKIYVWGVFLRLFADFSYDIPTMYSSDGQYRDLERKYYDLKQEISKEFLVGKNMTKIEIILELIT